MQSHRRRLAHHLVAAHQPGAIAMFETTSIRKPQSNKPPPSEPSRQHRHGEIAEDLPSNPGHRLYPVEPLHLRRLRSNHWPSSDQTA
jgi:hypothetical protein